MKTIELKLYKFSELSEAAKKIAIKTETEFQYEHGKPLFFFDEYCKEYLKDKGFNDCELTYRLSYSQGDGLSFSCKDFDIDKISENYLHGKLIKNFLQYSIKKNEGYYCFASKSNADLYLDNSTSKSYQNIEYLINKMKTDLENLYMECCKHLENEGYAQIEYSQQESIIIEAINENDYDYTEDGNKY